MGFQYPGSGPNFVPEYQVSSLPWVTSSSVTTGVVKEHAFEFVSRFLVVKNTDASANLAIAFTATGNSNNRAFVLTPGQTLQVEIRTKSVFVSTPGASATYQILAGLTQIPARNFPALTGSMGISV